MIRNIFTIQKVFNTLESSVTKSITSSLKESLISKSIIKYLPWHHATHSAMPIDSVIRDLSHILLTHWIMTMSIDFRDPSRILLTHWIVPMPIDSVIRDLSRDVMHPSDSLEHDYANRLRHQGSIMHPLDQSNHDHADRLRHQGLIEGCHASSWPIGLEDWWAKTSPPLMIDYSRFHVGFACFPLICFYMEITCTPQPKTLLCNQIFHIWEEKT